MPEMFVGKRRGKKTPIDPGKTLLDHPAGRELYQAGRRFYALSQLVEKSADPLHDEYRNARVAFMLAAIQFAQFNKPL